MSDAAKKYDRSKVEEGDRRIVDAMLNHTRPVESAAKPPVNKLAVALAVREAMREYRKGKPVAFQPSWRPPRSDRG